jgi:glycine C-acetyltransferase
VVPCVTILELCSGLGTQDYKRSETMDKFSFLNEELDRLETEGLLANPRTVEGPLDSWVQVDGKSVLNMSSNNYLGFANHPLLRQAAKKAIDQYGVGPAAVRTIAGTNRLHLDLEKRLAEFKGAEATLSFPSGCACNLAVIASLMGETDTIFSDELNHASIIDGCRLSRSKTVRYRHCDPAALDSLLHEHRSGRRLIVTDGVFSMDGDIAPLPEILEVAERHDVMLLVDDAHGDGVLGSHGRGIVDHFQLQGKVDIEVGTLSKAFGVVGGYVAGSKRLIEYFRQKGRFFLFSSAVTPPDAAACIAAIDILESSDEQVKKLWNNTRYFKEKMRGLGFDMGKSQTPIIPLIIGDVKSALQMSDRLFEEGIFAAPIAFPVVPRGTARIRVMISATHSEQDLDYAVERFQRIGPDFGLL